MHNLKIMLFLSCLLCLGLQSAQSQDLEKIGTRPKLLINGGFNIGTGLYSIKGLDARRSPFSYMASGSLRMKYGILDVPINFLFRDQQFSLGSSFNKIGISPRYKWIKLHLGHRSMRFTKYSMNGKVFFGVGAELTPGKFKLSAFRGNIRNPLAIRDTIVYGATLIPTYTRRATGAKIGYGSRSSSIEFAMLKIKDDTNTANPPRDIPENINLDLDPVDNLVLSTEWKLRLLRQLSIRGSINGSAYTQNLLLSNGEDDEDDDRALSLLKGLTTVNSSSKFSFAGELGINLNLRNLRLGAQYKRIEPEYRSLGIPFILNDIQATTFSAGVSLFKQKWIIDGVLGLEKNNLRNLDYSSRSRVLKSVRSNVNFNQNINLSLNHSNYQYEITDGLVEISDTLRFVNVNKNTSLSLNYMSDSEDFNYGGYGTIVRQVIQDVSPVMRLSDDVINNNYITGLNLMWKSRDFSIRPAFNYSKFLVAERNSARYGLSLGVRKGFFERRLQTNINTRYNRNTTNGKGNGYVWTNRLGVNYKLNETNALQFSSIYLKKRAIIGRNFDELRLNMSYGYRF